jgi:hypothetical protein
MKPPMTAWVAGANETAHFRTESGERVTETT